MDGGLESRRVLDTCVFSCTRLDRGTRRECASAYRLRDRCYPFIVMNGLRLSLNECNEALDVLGRMWSLRRKNTTVCRYFSRARIAVASFVPPYTRDGW